MPTTTLKQTDYEQLENAYAVKAERYAIVNWFKGTNSEYCLHVEVGTAHEIEKRFAEHDKVSRALFRDFHRRARPGDMVMISGMLLFRKAADSD